MTHLDSNYDNDPVNEEEEYITMEDVVDSEQDFVADYNKAVELGAASFIHRGFTIVTGFAKYVVEFWKDHAKKELDYTLTSETVAVADGSDHSSESEGSEEE